MKKLTLSKLEDFYSKYNHRDFVHPDPLEFLYEYEKLPDREIAGLIASGLAYGRVAQILKSVQSVLDKMGSPYDFLMQNSQKQIASTFHGFKHRFTTGAHLATMLIASKNIVEQYGSLEKCFLKGINTDEKNTLGGLSFLIDQMSSTTKQDFGNLLPHPSKGSACKRLNLFLRWMVRNDDVDPGGWEGISPSLLIIPLDTHMHKIGLEYGLTKRKNADMTTALEITRAFSNFQPNDPVRYDFALTRPGIRGE